MAAINSIVSKELDLLKQLKQPIIPSGSYFMLGNTTSDIDFFTLHTPDAAKLLESSGYTTNMSEKYLGDNGFISYRKGSFNVILVDTEDQLYAIELATYLCTELRVEDKDKRILVFKMFKLREIPEYDEKLKEKVHTSVSGTDNGMTVHDEVFDFPTLYPETGRNDDLTARQNLGTVGLTPQTHWEDLYQQYVERAPIAPAPRRNVYRALYGGIPSGFPPATLPGSLTTTTS